MIRAARNYCVLPLLVVCLVFSACMPEDIYLPTPRISTGNATSITKYSATLGGTVSGSSKSVTCGIIYGTSSGLSSSNGTQKSTSSSGSFTIDVTGLSPSITYYYRAYVVVDNEYKYGDECTFTTMKNVSVTTDDAIDLGLSVKWASYNVGATSPEEYGDYFAWGETTTKNDYSWNTYKWCEGTYKTMIKYCTDSYYGTVDSLNILTSSDDVATMEWGNEWRMPTYEEVNELHDECTWKWTTQSGVEGMKVTGPNGNSIFLPAAGSRLGTEVRSPGSYGFYWSGMLDKNSNGGYSLNFNSGSHDWYNYCIRSRGHTVRPVTEK